jgi:meiotically up-regulated gene 157 (Mug157) protein
MLSVELIHLADLLDSVQMHETATYARNWSTKIKNAIYEHTLIDGIFAYETNGYGARYVMDDANVPVSYICQLSRTSLKNFFRSRFCLCRILGS